MKADLEKPIEDYFAAEVEKRGGRALKMMCIGWAGMPDRWAFLPGGRLIILELKRPGKDPKPHQAKILWWLNSLGFTAGFANTKEAVDAFLKDIPKVKP